MELQIIGKNGLKLGGEARQYVEKKMTKFSRLIVDSEDVKVEIRHERTKSKQNSFIVQATISLKGTFLRAEERGGTIQEAADTVAEALERQIERYKTRHQKKAKGSSTVRQLNMAQKNAAAPTAMPSPRIVKVKQFMIKRVTIEEAIDQMELLNHDFFLFVNNQNNVLSLVYRRKSGDYGIIEPAISP
ncbi:MAG TPA: ribosome-associated translation inhibitor RaiA [Dehalococcoidia bacterium]|nr:ribosome-associated translation inhibitor RaiA [Dehalococcoidia bacterium]